MSGFIYFLHMKNRIFYLFPDMKGFQDLNILAKLQQETDQPLILRQRYHRSAGFIFIQLKDIISKPFTYTLMRTGLDKNDQFS
ncbi:hypothetical protein PT2222_140316 [Paraburkholderia tropica]